MSAEVLELYRQTPEEFNPLAGHSDPEQLIYDSLYQGTMLAGREKPFCWELDEITSEGALHRYRAEVEIEALICLAEYGPVDIDISPEEKDVLRRLYDPAVFDAVEVIKLDHIGDPNNPDPDKRGPLEHDVKSVEVYLGKLLDLYDLGHLKEWVHFGMTSEDTNNLAFNLMLRDAANKVLIPAVARVADRLAYLSATYADDSVLGITHAQKASPTTVGKQFGYMLNEITQVLKELEDLRLTGKFSGAVGNHNPMTVLFPDFDYDTYAKDFVESMGFVYNPIQNQRNDHLAVTNLLGRVERLALVGKDATDNTWLKILDNILIQKLVAGEKGSSTMSHKINPWRLESAESQFEQAIALMGRAPEGLVASRHERDLSDHGWQRAYGDMIGRVLVGYNYFTVQLDRLSVDSKLASEALSQAGEVLSELVQTAGRVSGDPEAYDKVVKLTQGQRFDLEGIQAVIKEALPAGEVRDRVLAVTPETYIGKAPTKAQEAVLGWHATKGALLRGILDESTSIDAVLLDFDGTLNFGDKDELFARLSAITAELKSGFTEEEIKVFGDRSDFRQMQDLMIAEHNRRFPNNTISRKVFREVNDSISGVFDHHFYTTDVGIEAIEKVRRSGKKIGLATTRGNMSRDRLLALHGLTELFDVIVGRDDVDRRKPHPHPLAVALEALGITDPRRSMYVGDLQTDDIGAGNALGMKTALVNEEEIDKYGPIPTYHWRNLEPLGRLYGR